MFVLSSKDKKSYDNIILMLFFMCFISIKPKDKNSSNWIKFSSRFIEFDGNKDENAIDVGSIGSNHNNLVTKKVNSIEQQPMRKIVVETMVERQTHLVHRVTIGKSGDVL
jgi:hypothetical protein